ncbi:MAG: hypothetical protein EA347_05465 [Thioalkalivibrio sp.]|nr:MAG: hypothetical protein EA347_05465 [Thioalkalivibrio sp.]
MSWSTRLPWCRMADDGLRPLPPYRFPRRTPYSFTLTIPRGVEACIPWRSAEGTARAEGSSASSCSYFWSRPLTSAASGT